MKIKVNDVELYYEAHGDGEPIIFVHGWMDDCSAWNSQIEFFAKKYKVIAYDHRGHGRSDKPEGDYSIQTLSNDLHTLIKELKLEKVTLVGHSMGGMTALLFTLDHPDKVSKLVSCQPYNVVSYIRYVLHN
uniref:Putative aminoacrylate hydrolase RutD n=1 Tax=Candidatus Methanophaga sp. ANME-1 ERB7 TaxID=2759913 RepID=A0A7G9Z7X1_9EURY|nr:putative aminoacrylate hydrolase RutD [Methanosarcinales archaeon ANME-1 ERB7]